MMLAILIAAGAQIALQAPFSHARVQGFSKDGRSAIFEASIDGAPDEEGTLRWSESVMVAIGADGRAEHVARYNESRADDVTDEAVPAEAKALWAGAEEEAAGQRLSGLVPEIVARRVSLEGAPIEMNGPAVARGRAEAAGACRSARLIVSMGPLEAIAFEDPCGDAKAPISSLSWAWNPSGTALALAWGVARGHSAHAHLGVLTAENLAALDLLDAGGAAAAALDKLALAGFRVAHRAAAVKKRDETAVFYAAGFQPQAQAVANALGAPSAAVQPVSWKTPYAVTVALGSR
jgi:hypothetical protein